MSTPTPVPTVKPHQGVRPHRLAAQATVGFVLLFGGIWLLARLLRPQLEGWGRYFVESFGIAGMALGTLLAETVHFPIPPQFYMLTAITTGTPIVPAMAAICVASVVGGNLSYVTGRLLGHLSFFERVLARARPKLDPLFERYGVWAIAVGALTPIPFSTLCLVSGIYRIGYKLFAVLVLLRVPRLLFFYWIIKTGWAS